MGVSSELYEYLSAGFRSANPSHLEYSFLVSRLLTQRAGPAWDQAQGGWVGGETSVWGSLSMLAFCEVRAFCARLLGNFPKPSQKASTGETIQLSYTNVFVPPCVEHMGGWSAGLLLGSGSTFPCFPLVLSKGRARLAARARPRVPGGALLQPVTHGFHACGFHA